ncbi:VOC family protein [Glutamicibacter sp. 287]|uniref:VOC family protein n=1 Tax=unclassified Glutamicibacter TaxID=2627139 RepID=UPI000BB97D54|nr:VOC family protein [Glutamicibacter sp. BW80]PCC29221.1 hypothetical protein CIK76_07335 [Glutamicibacter sp. BW80]
MQKFIPNLWFAGNAEEAGQYYAGVFPNTSTFVESRYPTEGLLDFQEPLAGAPLTITVELNGTHLTLINAGNDFTPNPSISFIVSFDPANYSGDADAARAALDQTWDQLVDGGSVLMGLDTYPFSARYGWVQDRYGISWQLMQSDAGQSESFVVPSLMFGGAAQNLAVPAVDFYVELFENSQVGSRFPYPEPTEVTVPGAVMFSDFTLNGQCFAAMDSAVAQPFSFSPGISIEVQCEDQAEIDRLWEALSAVPEAEQCGWLQDKFGVSWQVVPKNMGDLMARPGAFEKMLNMKKLVIEDF